MENSQQRGILINDDLTLKPEFRCERHYSSTDDAVIAHSAEDGRRLVRHRCAMCGERVDFRVPDMADTEPGLRELMETYVKEALRVVPRARSLKRR